MRPKWRPQRKWPSDFPNQVHGIRVERPPRPVYKGLAIRLGPKPICFWGEAAVEPSAGDPSGRWWFDPERVEGFVHGVFEGGGAKGILYVGALRGVLRRKLWFSSVAGS